MTTEPMILLDHVSKWYGQVIGVNDITCQVGNGITALLGPNGAGKSTMIKLISGQLKPTTGRMEVVGLVPFANPEVYHHLGYCPEIEQLYDEMTGREFVRFLGAMSGASGQKLKDRTDEVIQIVGMDHAADRKVGGYSKGMRQRVKLGQAIFHNPKVLILDEPFNGLDPIGRREMTNVLNSFAAKGHAVIVSSHILYEVEQMTDSILLMNRGRLLAQGKVHQIRSLIDKHPHSITIRTPDVRRMAKCLIDYPFIISLNIDPDELDKLQVQTTSPDEFYNTFPQLVLEHNFVISSFNSPDNNLESVFKYLVND